MHLFKFPSKFCTDNSTVKNDWLFQHSFDSLCVQNIYYETEVAESMYAVTTD